MDPKLEIENCLMRLIDLHKVFGGIRDKQARAKIQGYAIQLAALICAAISGLKK